MPLIRTGSPIELIKNDAYKEYYTESKDFLNQHKHLLKCTSCRGNLYNSVKLGNIHIHPLLLVLICEKCYSFYTSGDFSQDEDGYDKYCRWCGNGGLLYICSKCPYGFCKQCYKRNFPNLVQEMEDDDWKCIACDNSPLFKLQALVKVLLKITATSFKSSASSRPSRTSKRRRKLSSSSESEEEERKVSKPGSSKVAIKKKETNKKIKKSSSRSDNTTQSEKEIDEKQIPEIADEEFKNKSKEFLLLNTKNLKSSTNLCLEKCTKLLNKIDKSDLDKTSDILNISQYLFKLQETLKNNLENSKVNYGIEILKRKFIKRSMEDTKKSSSEDKKSKRSDKLNKEVKMSEDEDSDDKSLKSKGASKQSEKLNKEVKMSEDEDSDDKSLKSKGASKQSDKLNKSIKNKEVKMFDDEDSDDMFPKSKGVPTINFDSLFEKEDTDDDQDNDKKEKKTSKSDDESNKKILNGSENKSKTKIANLSDSENSEEDKKKKKKRKRSISSEAGETKKKDKKGEDDSDKEGNNDESNKTSEDNNSGDFKDKNIDKDNKKDKGNKKEQEEDTKKNKNVKEDVKKDQETEDIQQKFESEEEEEENLNKLKHSDNEKGNIKDKKTEDIQEIKKSGDKKGIKKNREDDQSDDEEEQVNNEGSFDNIDEDNKKEEDTKKNKKSVDKEGIKNKEDDQSDDEEEQVNNEDSFDNIDEGNKKEEDTKKNKKSVDKEGIKNKEDDQSDDEEEQVNNEDSFDNIDEGNKKEEDTKKNKKSDDKEGIKNKEDDQSDDEEEQVNNEDSFEIASIDNKDESNKKEDTKKNKKDKKTKDIIQLSESEKEEDKNEKSRDKEENKKKEDIQEIKKSGDTEYDQSDDEEERGTSSIDKGVSSFTSGSELESKKNITKRSRTSKRFINKGEKKIKKKEPLENSSDSDTLFERLCNIKTLFKNKVNKIIRDSDDEEEDDVSSDNKKSKQPSKTRLKKKKTILSENENEKKSIDEEDKMPELFKDDSDLNMDELDSLEDKIKKQMMDFIEENLDDEIKEEIIEERKSNSVKSKKTTHGNTDSNKKPSWRDHRLLRGKISDTDSENEFEKWEKHKKRPFDTEQRKRRQLRQRQCVQLISSGEEENGNPIFSTSPSEQEQFESTKNSSDSEDNKKKTKKLKRIKVVTSNSSSSDIEEIEQEENIENSQKKRKNIRKVIKDTETSDITKQAAKEEEERQKRIEERQRLFYELMEQVEVESNDNIILDIDTETKEPLVKVHPKIAVKLKPHQVKGVQFMFNTAIESIKEIEKGGKGNGCILAHCMGLGKTLQVVSLVHTLLTNPGCKIRTAMIVCPLSTVHNWIQEFRMWTKPCQGPEIEIFDLSRDKKNYERLYRLKDWQSTGGVLIIGYNLLRTMANPKARIKKSFKDGYMSSLIDPGADLVVCDEGHLLKNEKSALSQTMVKIKTLRRIILTGTPLQNNLIEYHCMVSFVKPNFLGTRKEFQNRFVNPITNGQFADSNTHDLRVMKRRAHVLHKMLESSVQRFDYSVLTPFLPPKFEFAVLIKLSDRQIKMYQHYLEYFATKPGSGVRSCLFADFQALQRISTHPRVLQLRQDRYDRDKARRLTESEDTAGSLNDFIDDTSNSHSTSSSDGNNSSDDDASIHSDEKKKKKKKRGPPKTRNFKKENPESSDEVKENKAEHKKEWWDNYLDNEEIMEDINESGKLVILFEILKECETIGDKILIFSQSLFSLDLIEYFLEQIDQQTLDKKLLRECNSTWIKGADYFRLDGSTQCEVRHEHCKHFNNPKNLRARLFLISTKAGGLGINLTAANRVIIFDASWNPSYDMQSIFRVYRFGQIKPCYIYRFLSQGTMEEKVYDRQVTKLSLSCRVVDEQQIERHFNMSDLAELYRFEPTVHITRSHGPPKDKLLADLMLEFPQWILDYHEHDSLLQNKAEEELNEDERKEAWEDYENEKKGGGVGVGGQFGDLTQQSNLLFQQYFNQTLTRLIQQFPSKTFEELKKVAISVAANQVQVRVEQFQQKQLLQQQLLQQQQQQQLGEQYTNSATTNKNLTQKDILHRHKMQIQYQNQLKYAQLFNNVNLPASSSYFPLPNQSLGGQSSQHEPVIEVHDID